MLGTLWFQCSSPVAEKINSADSQGNSNASVVTSNSLPRSEYTGILGYVSVTHNVNIEQYFSYVDSVVNAIDTSETWRLDEYALIHFNSHIIDTLKATDYYLQKAKGVFLYDQSKKVVLRKNDSLAIPDPLQTSLIQNKLKSTILDLNIPEYTLRIIQSGDTLLKTKVRVGRNERKYLALAGHHVDLRTPIGEGEIIRIERNPIVINPETGKKYTGTYRDDGRFTKMPIIPWLEPKINGIRYGALIHPTTNPETLGHAYSHGCVGTSEADAWFIYYNAPVGTKVNFRYELRIINSIGDTVNLSDIYEIKMRR